MSFLAELPENLPSPVDLDQGAGHAPIASVRKLYPALAERYSRNPHGITCYAEECRRALQLAERTVLALVGASEADARITWCANGTEALNLALRGFPFHIPPGELAVDAGAHPALLNTAHDLKAHCHEFLLDDAGGIPDALPEKTALAALSMVNNETGLLWNGNPRAIPPKCRLLVDGCQAFGKHPIPWEGAHIDMLVLSGRKLGAPAASACLISRRDILLKPLLTGGGQQRGLLSGTVDVVNALLFAHAAQEACRDAREALARIAILNRRLKEGLRRLGGGAWPFFSPENASPYILYFAIPKYEGALVARLLAANHNILVGTGSACTAESSETSPLLKRLGIPDDLARSAIRLSLSQETTPEEIDAFLAALPKVLRDF